MVNEEMGESDMDEEEMGEPEIEDDINPDVQEDVDSRENWIEKLKFDDEEYAK